MAVELNQDSTHEDIQKAVDTIVEDQEKEKVALSGGEEDKISGDLSTTAGLGPENGDAKKIAEERDQPTTEREIPTVEEDSDSGDDDSGEDWLTDDLKAEVTAYGIDEEELADFTSREEVERALRLFDKSALEAGRKALAETAEGKESQETERRFAKKEPAPTTEPKEGQSSDEISFSDLWDEDAKTELEQQFTRMRDRYESRIEALETRFTEADAAIAEANAVAEEQQFDRIVDSLGLSELFGKSGKEKAKELERRKQVFEDWKIRKAGFEQLGRQVEMSESIIHRAARSIFPDEFDKRTIKAHTRKISRQANSRGGDSATKGASPVESLRDEMRRLYKEKEGVG